MVTRVMSFLHQRVWNTHTVWMMFTLVGVAGFLLCFMLYVFTQAGADNLMRLEVQVYPVTLPSVHEQAAARNLQSIEGMTVMDRKIHDLTSEITNGIHATIRDNLGKCLAESNMTDFLISEGLLEAAEVSAKYYVNAIEQFVPHKFRESRNHCWIAGVDMTISHSKSAVYGHIMAPTTHRQLVFHANVTDSDRLIVTRHQNSKNHHHLPISCIPEVFLAGFPKCGSSFLYNLLIAHQSIIRPVEKEPHYWALNSHFIDPNPMRKAMFMADYLINYENLVNRGLKLLSVDATPSLMFDWPDLGQRLEVNMCLLPSVIPEILPKAKFIVIMRNPVTMLYSRFWHDCTRQGGHVPLESQLKGPNVFHERVKKRIKAFNSCIEVGYPLAKCVSNPHLHPLHSPEFPCGSDDVHRGIFYVYVRKWLSVVPRSRFLFLTMEELSAHTDVIASRIWEFLNLPPFTIDAKLMNPNQQQKVDYHHDPRLAMRNDTKIILEQFFRPYNQMLADLLGDNIFLWQG